MAKITDRHLKGSTLIEVLVASVIFLTVFICSFSILPVLTPGGNAAADMIEADSRVSTMYHKLSDGIHENGKYSAKYTWGEINACLEPYSDYTDLQQLSITVVFVKNRKKIVYKYVVERNR